MAVYAGMVTGMDRNIGRLVDDLRRHREIENTLILFLSDNGACAEWEPFGFDLQPVARPQPGTGINVGTPGAPNVLHRGVALAEMGGPGSLFSYGSGWANASNTPFRFYKHYDHEGGISTPLIVHWPAGTKRRGEFERRVGHVIDLMATCAEAAGATIRGASTATRSCPWKGAVSCRLSAVRSHNRERSFGNMKATGPCGPTGGSSWGSGADHGNFMTSTWIARRCATSLIGIPTSSHGWQRHGTSGPCGAG